ncbi:MAG: 1,5-anhydro-D-fructose reductase (1,5-anhydro-D-mannitol-forming) [Gammaproteobacteria bacterium]|jgi:1,5-anhydro-D-fructose reductase (1,5-anhydro-D-mannitol-forming)
MRGIGIIGLGSIGLRMLGGITAHTGFKAVHAWDPAPQACDRASAAYRDLTIAGNTEELIHNPQVDVVYVACPPRFHRQHVLAAIDAGKPILCEKPLGVDLDESRDLLQRIEDSQLPNAVNLLYASSRASHDLGVALRGDDLGPLSWVEIQLHLPNWAAKRYAEAPWLAERSQGGFVREVTTHFMFLCQRLFGEVTLQTARVDFPDDGVSAEQFAAVRLDASGLPITITGTTKSAGPEVNRITFWGEKSSMRIDGLHILQIAHGDGDRENWRPAYPAPDNPELDTYLRQLDNLAAMLDGQAHTLADFRAAFATQELIESILAFGEQTGSRR